MLVWLTTYRVCNLRSLKNSNISSARRKIICKRSYIRYIGLYLCHSTVGEKCWMTHFANWCFLSISYILHSPSMRYIFHINSLVFKIVVIRFIRFFLKVSPSVRIIQRIIYKNSVEVVNIEIRITTLFCMCVCFCLLQFIILRKYRILKCNWLRLMLLFWQSLFFSQWLYKEI